jgi:hypothetical protein
LTDAPYSARILRSGLVVVAVAAGIAFIALAILYWSLPADSLPSWLPGHKPHSHPHHGHHHKRHGLTAFLLGVTALALAWEAKLDRDS